jgi:hypothetical protein
MVHTINTMKIYISAKTYAGFTIDIDNETYYKMTRDEVITHVKFAMKQYFTTPQDLYVLRDGVDKLKLHRHDDDTQRKDYIYLCDHE